MNKKSPCDRNKIYSKGSTIQVNKRNDRSRAARSVFYKPKVMDERMATNSVSVNESIPFCKL
jgi:hypothetical protein